MALDYQITEDQVSFFKENGYIQLHDVLTAEELENIRQGVEEVKAEVDRVRNEVEPKSEYNKIFLQMVNIWRINDKVREYTLLPKIGRIAQELAGYKLRLWHDHALIKMPGDSKPSSWHQDLPYWPHNEGDSLSCWMALDDVTEDNGCMWFVPKSHTWGKFEPILLGNAQDIFEMVPDPQEKDFTKVPMPMKAGSCTFHHSLTFHYAHANSTDKPRRAMVSIFMRDGTTYSGAAHVVTDGQDISVGDVLSGELFPEVE